MEKDKKDLKEDSLIKDDSVNIESLSDVSKDEDSIQKAMQSSAFKLFFVRNFIKVKNHISIIPLLMTIVCFVVLTINIPTFIYACDLLRHSELNAFLFFVNVLLALLSVLLYFICYNKKTKKVMFIIALVLFLMTIAGAIVIDVFFILDANIETTQLYNSLNIIKDNDKGSIAGAISISFTHTILLAVTALLAILAPILQPLTRKIHLKR